MVRTVELNVMKATDKSTAVTLGYYLHMLVVKEALYKEGGCHRQMSSPLNNVELTEVHHLLTKERHTIVPIPILKEKKTNIAYQL